MRVFTNEVFVIALVSVVAVYAGAKLVALGRGPRAGCAGLALFLTVWPGMLTRPFADRRHPATGGGLDSVRSAASRRGGRILAGGLDSVRSAASRRGGRILAGAVLVRRGLLMATAGACAWVAVAGRDLPPAVVGWLGIAIILATVHLGLCDVLTGGLRLAGFPVARLFADPLASRTLREFWSRRWNVAFVEMNQVVFLPWLRRRLNRAAYAAAFVLSGLLHELAISLPVGTGFGQPTLYFTLHAVATGAEGRLGVRRWPTPLARLWTWAWVILPLPLLFHRAFRDALVLPLFGG